MQDNPTEGSQEMPSAAAKTVVITGASSGIGRAAALEFACGKANIVAIARSEQALRDLAKECEERGSKVMIAPVDVADEGAMKSIAARAVQNFGRIDVWVNDAAVTTFGKLEEIPYDALRRVIDTNLFGYINGARAVLPHFRAQGRGVLINVSSVNGKVAQPYVSAYNATKFAINGFSESLRMELQDAPEIRVCTVLAASVDTPFFQHGANYTGRAVKPIDPVYSAEKVAQTIVQLAEHPQREVIVGNAGRVMMLMHALAPGMTEKAIVRKVEHSHFQDRPAPVSPGNLFSPMTQSDTVSGGWRGEEPERGNYFRALLLGIGAAGIGFAFWRLSRSIRRRGSLRRRGGILGF